MHEYSLAQDVIRLAEYEAEKNNARIVSEITIEIGNMSGVDADAFESALGLIKENSVLQDAYLNIIRIWGRGVCNACNKEFEMNQRMDTCPECGSFPSEIKGGNEFRVVSLEIYD
jgi:hydrogenase nickel incorporation protein HypA/HybF